MTKVNPYNPLELEALGLSLLMQLERETVHSLDSIRPFPGSSIYALYYCGVSAPYSELGAYNSAHNCRIPLYVGRAKETGARQGNDPFKPVAGAPLWERIRQHGEASKTAGNLNSLDFTVRALVVMPI